MTLATRGHILAGQPRPPAGACARSSIDAASGCWRTPRPGASKRGAVELEDSTWQHADAVSSSTEASAVALVRRDGLPLENAGSWPSRTRCNRRGTRESSPPATAPPCSGSRGPRPACSPCAKARRSARNLQRLLMGQTAEPFQAPGAFSCDYRHRRRQRGGNARPMAVEGRWVWLWKDFIDRSMDEHVSLMGGRNGQEQDRRQRSGRRDPG